MNEICYVYDIKVNNDEPFDIDIPVHYVDIPPMIKTYLRVWAMDYLDIDFKFNYIENPLPVNYTERDERQDYYLDLMDSDFGNVVKAKAYPMYKNAHIVRIDIDDKNDLSHARQLIYEQLCEYLNIDFMVNYK